jgi:VIT1/CCC1 family predicted Fe2+/Mn2+ transporter
MKTPLKKDQLPGHSHPHGHDDGPHVEEHFTGNQFVRDAVIGMSDGLTVPFALAAGLSSAVAATKLVVTAGLAEVAAGAIAMGLGGYLAARSDADHYASELARERREVVEKPAAEVREVEEVFEAYGLTKEQIAPVISAFKAKPEAWVQFMMQFELGLDEPDPKQALKTAATIAGAYIAGGMIPLSPYFFLETTAEALWPSVGVTAVALTGFGYVKGRFTTGRPWASAAQTLFIGGAAALVAYGLARLLS